MALTEDEIKAAFNEQAKQLEDHLNNLVGSSDPCIICPTDGCIVLDFSECNNFDVLVTEDITCMRMVGEGAPGNINFIIPPNTTRRICGFPSSFGGEGNECDIDLEGGDKGSTFGFGHGGSAGGGTSGGSGMGKPGIPKKNPTSDGSGSGGGGGSGGACSCIPEDGQLTLVVCGKLNCADASPKFEVRACGGFPGAGYSWDFTGDGTGTISGTDLSKFSLAPGANDGSGVAGVAYQKHSIFSGLDAVGNCSAAPDRGVFTEHGCNEQLLTACVNYNSGTFGFPITCGGNPTAFCDLPFCVDSGVDSPPGCTTLCGKGGSGKPLPRWPDTGCVCPPKFVCDKRTVQMITDGCTPCSISMGGVVVTVTDALGTSVSKTVEFV